MPATPETSFSRLQKLLHWSVVVLLLLQYLIFDAMGRLFRQTLESGSPVWTTTSIAHLVIGLTVLALALWRVALRIRRGAPPPPADEPSWAITAGKLTHAALYVLLIGLPLGGLAAWGLGIHLMGDIHAIGTNLLLVVAGLHVAAVLVHQFWWKTNLLARMR